MSATILDMAADKNYRELYRFSRLYDFPEYVKQADPQQTCHPEELPATVYADIGKRRYPCHTKAACYLSWLYFLEKQSQLSPKFRDRIEDRLSQFADYWGLSGDVSQLRQKHAALHDGDLGQLPDSAFAYVWADENGHKDRRYPLRNTLEVKAAADWFLQYRDHFPFEDRQTIAERILEKASQYGASLGEESDAELEKQAGRGLYNSKEAATALRNRVRATSPSPDLREGMLKLANSIEANPMLAQEPDNLIQLAKTLDGFDRATKLTGKYSELIPRPEDVVFRYPYKTAAAFVDDGCELLSGSVYTKDQLSKVALSDVRDLFGERMAEAVRDGIRVDPEKLAEIATTLPRPEAVKFDQLLSSQGVRPLFKQAASRINLTHADWQELARLQPAGPA